jgi:endonuclease/exonuclease/phosphatase (EEP) superfamily protein YafD
VYNLHADAGHLPGDLDARRASFAQLADFIAEHSAGQALIVGGDFNLCWSNAGDRAAFEELLHRTELHDVANAVGRPDSRVDRFLFRSGSAVELAPVSLDEAAAFATEAGVPLSDHPALAARFAWRKRSSP